MRILKTITLLTILVLAAIGTAKAQNLTVTPTSGAGGLTITATSSGFDPGNVGFNTGFYIDGGFVAACPSVDGERANCSVMLQMPGGPVGPHTISAFNSNREFASTTFTVLPPKLSINPTCGPPGTEISITGKNFPVIFDTEIFFGGINTGVHARPDASGNLSAVIQVPSVTDGQYSVRAIATLGTNVAHTFTVAPACGQVGHVTDAHGTVERSPDGINFTPLHDGDAVHMNDVIRTAPNGRATVRFNDQTFFTLASENNRSSEIKIDQYGYNPSNNEGNATTDFLRGVFSYVSGLMHKEDPPNINIETSSGTIGIRGTEFIGQRDQVAGTVEVDLIHGSVDISPNQTVNTTTYNAPIKIVFNGTGATTAPLTQDEYDEIKARLFPPTSTDTAPPQVNVSFATPPAGQAGFFNAGQTPVLGTASASDVSNVISINCTDTLSGLSVGTFTGGGTANATRDLGVAGDGSHIISCAATDGANNIGAAAGSSSMATVKIDTTAPTVTYAGNLGSYTVDQTVNITCGAADALSGVFSSTCSNITGPAYSFNTGANSFGATAVDNAGNSGNGSTSFTVMVAYDGLISLVYRFETKANVAAKMVETLQSAQRAAANGNFSSANNQLNAFINQVQAQSGKSLTTDQTAILIRLARALKT